MQCKQYKIPLLYNTDTVICHIFKQSDLKIIHMIYENGEMYILT